MTITTIKCNRYVRDDSYEKTGYEIELNSGFELTNTDYEKIVNALADIKAIFDPLIEKKLQSIKAEREKEKTKGK